MVYHLFSSKEQTSITKNLPTLTISLKVSLAGAFPSSLRLCAFFSFLSLATKACRRAPKKLPHPCIATAVRAAAAVRWTVPVAPRRFQQVLSCVACLRHTSALSSPPPSPSSEWQVRERPSKHAPLQALTTFAD